MLTLENDKKYFIANFLDIIENGRLRRLANREAEIDPITEYYKSFYTRKSIVDENLIVSPNEVTTYLEAKVDTILYSNDRQYCLALLLIKCNYRLYDGIKPTFSPVYKGVVQYGHRTNVDTVFSIFPVKYGILIYDYDKKRAIKVQRDYYLEQKDMLGPPCLSIDPPLYFINRGDSVIFSRTCD